MKPDADTKMTKRAADRTDPVWMQYGRQLHRYLSHCLRHERPQDASDLAQEIYLRLLRVEKSEPIRNYQAYLYRIASHVVYEFKLRARRELVTFDSEEADAWSERPAPYAEDPVGEQVGLERQLARALEKLPPVGRQVLILHKQEGRSYAETAQALGISENMVHKHLTRALALLRAAKWDL